MARSVADRLSIAPDKPARQLINAIETMPPIAGVGGLISADRVFGLIERDFLSSDIYRAIAAALKPERSPDLSAHRILLELAKGPDGTVRLITTNFDLLFEDCDPAIPFSKPPRLPDPLRSDEFGGIIHLHGHVTSDYGDAAGDGFVISSAEFGRAYLSDRWAADFIRTVLERFFVVFVGYSADDPPMQYLLEALNRSPGSLSGVYAFQSGAYEEAEARWVQKGVRPIVYEESRTHAALWDTLGLWAERARSPSVWYDKLFAQASVGPEKCEPHIRGQIAHVVSTLEGAKRVALASQPLPADWLCTFDPYIRYAKPGRIGSLMEVGPHFDPFMAYGLDSDPVPAKIDPDSTVFEKRDIPAAFALTRPDRQNLGEDQVSALRGHWAVNAPRLAARVGYLGRWLQRVAHQPAAVWWAASQKGLHPDIQRQIESKIGDANDESSSAVRAAWRYLIDTWKHAGSEHSEDWYHLLEIIKLDGWDAAAVRDFAKTRRPRLKVERAFSGSPRAPDSSSEELENLLHLDVEYLHHGDEVVAIPAEFLPSLLRELRNNLELGSALEEELGGYGLHMLESINADTEEDESERSYKSGINILLFEYIEHFRRLLEIDAPAAEREIRAWRDAAGPIAAHIKIWSCGDSRLVSHGEFAEVLRTISREEFWYSSHQRDLLFALRNRWNELGVRTRISIERRLLQGPGRWKRATVSDFKKARASAILNRIYWLVSNGCSFTFNLDATTRQLREDYPEWQAEWASSATFSTAIRTGWVGTDTRSDELLDLPLAEILDAAAKLSGRSQERFVERDPYAGFCALKPIRAFSALTIAGKTGKYPRNFWQTFLNADGRKQDRFRLVLLIVSRLGRIPDDYLNDLLRPVTDWLLRVHKTLLPRGRNSFDLLWRRLVSLLEQRPDFGESSIVRGSQPPDWVTEALNSPIGHLAQILLADPAVSRLKGGEQFPDRWKGQANELLSLRGEGRPRALAILCHNLAWLFSVDPQWVTQSILPAMERQDHNGDAFWAGFFWGAKVPQAQLFVRMKPSLLGLAHKGSYTRRRHAEVLAGIVLAGWGSRAGENETRLITDAEMTAVLADADDDFRTQVLWHLERWSREPGSRWRDDAVTLLAQVWPKQIVAKTPRVSARLAELAFAQGERFPLYASYILPLVGPVDQDFINLPALRRNKHNLVDEFPEQTLAILHGILADDARQWPYGVSEVLDRIGTTAPNLLTDRRLIKLNRIRNSF
ncbi:SIR2 family protein [Bradyrhizobium sp. Leo121]|uniref:SIR2 family protein n=1 Tax=Bradyrhizobium sp. Leo121 TaxID=1571195 RepID=UPI001028C68F|nr:SIR2 family protein [Bradyrhizobium sp. Leo121]